MLIIEVACPFDICSRRILPSIWNFLNLVSELVWRDDLDDIFVDQRYLIGFISVQVHKPNDKLIFCPVAPYFLDKHLRAILKIDN